MSEGEKADTVDSCCKFSVFLYRGQAWENVRMATIEELNRQESLLKQKVSGILLFQL